MYIVLGKDTIEKRYWSPQYRSFVRFLHQKPPKNLDWASTPKADMKLTTRLCVFFHFNILHIS